MCGCHVTYTMNDIELLRFKRAETGKDADKSTASKAHIIVQEQRRHTLLEYHQIIRRYKPQSFIYQINGTQYHPQSPLSTLLNPLSNMLISKRF